MAFDKQAYDQDFIKRNYYRTFLTIPKDRQDDLKALAKREGMSINELLIAAVRKAYGVDLSK